MGRWVLVRLIVKEKVQEVICHPREGILFMRSEAGADISTRLSRKVSGRLPVSVQLWSPQVRLSAQWKTRGSVGLGGHQSGKWWLWKWGYQRKPGPTAPQNPCLHSPSMGFLAWLLSFANGFWFCFILFVWQSLIQSLTDLYLLRK